LVDIHCHILPDLDDGPPNMASALAMARVASVAGIDTVAATPHLRRDFPDVRVDELADRCNDLRAAIDADGIGLNVVCAAEVSLSWALEATDEELRLASYAQCGDIVLIEASSNETRPLSRLIYEVRMRGYTVVLAHVERLSQLQALPSGVDELMADGVVLQINAESLLRDRRSSRGKFAQRLCRRGQASVIASDGHRGFDERPISDLQTAWPVLKSRVGEARASWMIGESPRRLLSDGVRPSGPDVDQHVLRGVLSRTG
jgi:protein-tyrosine phosphatase